MEIKIKRFGLFLLTITMLILLVGCAEEVTVHFDTNGGNSINDITFVVGEDIDMPEDPIKEGYKFEN